MAAFLRSYYVELILMGLLLAAVVFFAYLGYGLLSPELAVREFSGDEAYGFVEEQLAFGPRTTGSDASEEVVNWLTETLRSQGWSVVIQPYDVEAPAVAAPAPLQDTRNTTDTVQPSLEFSFNSLVNLRARNVVAIREPAGAGPDNALPVMLVVAPFDSRLTAVDDPQVPTPGANIGASGAATLLELAHSLNVDISGHRICLVFLDGEANRGLAGWTPPFGGEVFIREINDGDADLIECADPRLAVVLEAVGGQNQRIEVDPISDVALRNGLWSTAAELAAGAAFVEEVGRPLPGPHNTFAAAQIPTVAVMEQGYPYRHASEDTLDKVGAASLADVGYTLQVWLESGAPAIAE